MPAQIGVSYIEGGEEILLKGDFVGEPFLCSLGFHKWQNTGNAVEVFWQEPAHIKADTVRPSGVLQAWTEKHHEVVYEGKQCKRCGMRLRRKFSTDSDGTLSCAGWEPETEENGRAHA